MRTARDLSIPHMMQINQLQIYQAVDQVMIDNDPLLIAQTLTYVMHDSNTVLRLCLAPF